MSGEAFDTLFVFGRGPDLFDNVTIHMKLAQLERSKRNKSVEIILMHDAAWWAQKDGKGKDLVAAPPDDDMTVDVRMAKLLESGVVVNVCRPCMEFRKIAEESLHPGIHITDGMAFMEKKDLAHRTLTFL